jgi:hypothetical protein
MRYTYSFCHICKNIKETCASIEFWKARVENTRTKQDIIAYEEAKLGKWEKMLCENYNEVKKWKENNLNH